ncbi:choice-of-anchor P family protein [Nocardioides rubriscoriae]|uniref:choice-of-anchor P family protein n=1 Tax=Nocardioides rubriscoriae TaxID=642762 RepID=UPI0011DF7A04|nr:choice-of-anchor P family protein [Nocardioides rubriscoriae]
MSGHHSTNPHAPLPVVLPSATRSGRAGRSHAVEALAARRTTLRRVAGGFAAVAVVGATLSVTAAPGQAVGGPATAAGKKPGFAGYSTSSTASPLKVEIYEPTIPLPAEPQAEVSVGYSSVLADSASSRSRASYLWPGAPVGEGFKTIVEALMLPPELAGPIAGQGYPVQVNAVFPSGPKQEADEPLPGMVQRAVAGDGTARAENASSTDAQAQDDDASGDGGDGGDGGGGGPIPGLPDLPGVPGLPATGGLTSLLGGGRADAAAPTKVAAGAPVLPEPLAALVDVGGFTSVSKTDSGDLATAQARSVASDITILGGLVTIDSVTTVSSATSDGKTGKGLGKATYGDVVIAGQRFAFGPDGFEAVGQGAAVPGLPAQGVDLLKELGITISVPKPTYTLDGDAASTAMQGLVVDFDLRVLKAKGGGLTDALNTVIGALPDDQGVPIKSGLQAAVNAAPRMVFYLGTSFAGVDTSEAIAPPPPPAEAPTDDATDAAAGGGAAASSGGGSAASPTDSGPVPAAPAGDAPTTEAISPVGADTVPGLPPLLSFPGLLLYGGLLGAGIAGFFTRRLGLMALGGTGSCAHGLTSGLPDLRKVT